MIAVSFQGDLRAETSKNSAQKNKQTLSFQRLIKLFRATLSRKDPELFL
jgi:hypothetical protein